MSATVEPTRAVRVLVVDDSSFARRVFRRVLSDAPGVSWAGDCEDGESALAACERLSPDVVLLDLDLPVRDGLSTLEELRRTQPKTRVIVVSASARPGASMTHAALALGAVDFVNKSAVGTMRLHELGHMVLEKIRVAAESASDARSFAADSAACCELLAVGASTGGPQALLQLLGAFPADFPVPIVVAQHIHGSYLSTLAARIDEEAALPCCVARPGQELGRGIWFAPPGKNAIVLRRSGRVVLSQKDAPPETPHVPSIDALFESAAQSLAERAWGALLTGMGRDGAEGLLAIRRAGGFTLVQDEASSVVFGMPRAALELGAARECVPLKRMASLILEVLARGNAPAGGLNRLHPGPMVGP